MITKGKKRGLLVRIARGAYALSPETTGKIERRESILIGHNRFVLDLASMRAAPGPALRIVR
jgi:thioester reductase-like protein